MGIFGATKTNKTKSTAKKEVAKKEIVKQSDSNVKKINASFAHDVIVFPRITDKSNNVAHLRQYVFNVRKDANKDTVRKAVEQIYNVKVEKVRIANVPTKRTRTTRVMGKKYGYKKALVTLKEGFTIEVTPQ